MERPSWAPVVLSGTLPRELPDFLAMLILGLASLEGAASRIQISGFPMGPWILLFTIPPACALAALSNTSRKQREELALFAYGGSGWHIHLRYFLRGAIVVAIAVSPLIVRQITISSDLSGTQMLLVVVMLLTGGAFYAMPSLRRTRSREFVENYKG